MPGGEKEEGIEHGAVPQKQKNRPGRRLFCAELKSGNVSLAYQMADNLISTV
jgi:hypothetical protein